MEHPKFYVPYFFPKKSRFSELVQTGRNRADGILNGKLNSYGRDGFVTPIAVRSDSDLGGVDASEDAAFVNEYGAEGTSRDDQVVPDGCICLDHFDRCQSWQADAGNAETALDGGGDGDWGR
mgnify:CR=1 FL=1